MQRDDRPALLGIPLPAALAARIGPARLRIANEFLRFGVVGTAGFLVDAGVLTAAIWLGLGPWWGRVASYIAGASTTYALNRAWTFRDRAGAARAGQWAMFMLLNLGGFTVNYGTYAVLLLASETVRAWPVLGVAAGSIAGLAVNFTLSRRFVFNARPGATPGPGAG
ncbi:MAG: GtrA family protein [Acetobacteraceae bacterium]|nr:GtrA family protein [Acetobacteraceae bacterium]